MSNFTEPKTTMTTNHSTKIQQAMQTALKAATAAIKKSTTVNSPAHNSSPPPANTDVTFSRISSRLGLTPRSLLTNEYFFMDSSSPLDNFSSISTRTITTMMSTTSPTLLANFTDEKLFTQLDPGNASFVANQSDNLTAVAEIDQSSGEYVFDRTDVRVIFITLYTLVFCCCFFGNLLVILVVTLSRRLRSITNFFLANLALADFCVGLFCVMQNLSIYLIDSWVFGEFLCRMYQFVHSLSYTASIFILVVICMERYFAIVHPITCKQILTAARLRIVILTVWITSAVYSTPKFVFSKTIRNIHKTDGAEEDICVLDRKMFNSKLLDMINFGLLYVTPLLVMTVLYSKIAIALWRSSRGLTHHTAQQDNTSITMCPSHNNSTTLLARKQSSKYDKRGINKAESKNGHFKVSIESDRPIVTTCRNKASFYHHQRHGTQRVSHMSHSSNNVLRARRGVVRMLIIFVLTFALCNLPYHARKMWQYWSRSYRGDSNFNALLTPLTFLVTYFNSGINPLLYAFLSRNFRKGMRELLMCSLKKSKSKSSSSSVHHKRAALQVSSTHSLPTDSTHIGNEQL